jgi:F-box/leucine-rich repeat protein 2/20
MLQDLSNVNLGYLPVLFVGKLLHCVFATFCFVSAKGRGLLSLVSGCQRITTLKLTRCMQVKSMEWLELLGRKGRLEHLSIKHCKGIGEADLRKLGNGWRRLQEFHFEVDPTQRYTEVFVAKDSVSQQHEPICKKLRVLSLKNCLANPSQGLAQV